MLDLSTTTEQEFFNYRDFEVTTGKQSNFAIRQAMNKSTETAQRLAVWLDDLEQTLPGHTDVHPSCWVNYNIPFDDEKKAKAGEMGVLELLKAVGYKTVQDTVVEGYKRTCGETTPTDDDILTMLSTIESDGDVLIEFVSRALEGKTFSAIITKVMKTDINGNLVNFYNIKVGSAQPIFKQTGHKATVTPASKTITVKELKEQFSYLKEVSSVALQQSRRDLESAYSRFFSGISKAPKFHSKRQWTNSAPATNSRRSTSRR